MVLDTRVELRAQETALAAVAPALCDVAVRNFATLAFEVRDRPGTTPLTTAQRTAALSALTALDWGAAALDAWHTTRQRADAKALYDALTADGKRDRAIVLAVLDEVNTLRQWIMAFKVEVAAAVSLADLKARVALLPSLPDRTGAQARTAIRGKIDSGSAD